MSDDDRGRSSDPFGPRESEPGERGMTFFGATAWAMLATLGLHYLGSVVASIRHPSTVDITTLVGVQTVVTLLLLFGILRFYAPNLSIRHFLGLRRTHVGFYVVAILLGAIVHVPADGLFDAITKHYPTDPELDRLLEEQLAVSTSRRVALGVAIVGIGPFIEEVFYRGALFRPLRKTASAWSVVVVTSVLFGLAHVEWQRVVPIGLLGLALGLLRISSGSLVPSAISARHVQRRFVLGDASNRFDATGSTRKLSASRDDRRIFVHVRASRSCVSDG
ncbi:MAG: CPBP family intramembrane metalloprotease [Polyangiaceae bacterium]|nr:CPBP family intramembrane metalloprotease [Polyangiaceae bacterium]